MAAGSGGGGELGRVDWRPKERLVNDRVRRKAIVLEERLGRLSGDIVVGFLVFFCSSFFSLSLSLSERGMDDAGLARASGDQGGRKGGGHEGSEGKSRPASEHFD